MKRAWPGYVLAYLAWIIVLALGIGFMFLGRSGLLGALAVFQTGDPVTRVWRGRLYERAFIIAVGVVWIVLMVVVEAYFREGVRRRQLLRRFARVVGPEILLIFAVDLLLFWLQGDGGPWLRWLILGVELVAGVALLVFSWLPRAPGQEELEPDKATDSMFPT